jgi:hypothetical protein
MASGNKVFRAVRTYFLNGVKVPVGSLVREGHAVAEGVEHHLKELKIDFEREDIQAQKDAKAAADKADADAKAAVKSEVAKEAPAVEDDVVKAAEAEAAKVEKAAS